MVLNDTQPRLQEKRAKQNGAARIQQLIVRYKDKERQCSREKTAAAVLQKKTGTDTGTKLVEVETVRSASLKMK
jgi:hypothetical protein